MLDQPLPASMLHRVAASLGADVPFFLRNGAQLATADGTALQPIALPRNYTVVLALEHGAVKRSTGEVYGAFDRRHGEHGFDERREALAQAVRATTTLADLARLPANDLASSPLADELRTLGAFRADVTGAGPVVYGLFESDDGASAAARALEGRATTWVANPG
jgi:4-diphosphocytidyl-2-C-methyl-D-erythritol kinase